MYSSIVSQSEQMFKIIFTSRKNKEIVLEKLEEETNSNRQKLNDKLKRKAVDDICKN